MAEEDETVERHRQKAEGYPEPGTPLAGKAFHSKARRDRRRRAVQEMTGRMPHGR